MCPRFHKVIEIMCWCWCAFRAEVHSVLVCLLHFTACFFYQTLSCYRRMAKAPAGLVPPKFNIDQPRLEESEVSSLEVEFNLSDGTRAPTGEELVNFSLPPTPWTSLWPLLNLIKQRWTSCWLAEKNQVSFRKLWWNIEKENWTTCPKMKYGPQNICMTQPFILIQVISSLDIMSRYHKMYIVIQWKIRTKLQERRWSCLEECQPRWC